MNGFNLDESQLLKQYRQAKDIDIERLLTQYGTSLKDVREMYPQLTGAIKQRQLTTTLPTQPMFFTATEAQQMGLGIGEGWMLKFTPIEGNGGFTSSLITPEKWEITESDLYVSPTGEQYSRADLEALLAVPGGDLAGTEPFAPEPITVADLTEEGQQLYEEYQGAGGELGIEGWLQLREQEYLETEQVFGAVFPEQDISELIAYIETNPEEFLADLREIGWTQETEALLQAIIPDITQADMQELFGTAVVPEYIPEHWLKDAFDAFLVGAVNFIYGLGERFLGTMPSIMESLAPEVAKLITTPIKAPIGGWAYVAEMLQGETHIEARKALEIAPETAAELVSWATNTFMPSLQEDAERNFMRLVAENDAWLLAHPEFTPKPEYSENPFEHPELFLDPGYIAYTISSSLVYSLTVMGTMIAVSAVASPVAGIPAGMMVASAPEAASMTAELVKQGVPFEEAAKWGELYGFAAGGIEVVSDLPFLGLIFKPIKAAMQPMWNTILRGTANRLARAAITAVIIPNIEGLEEVLTQVIHNAILKHYDATQSILEGVSHAYIQGVIASLPFGAIGGGASFTTFRANLSEETGQRYDDLVSELQRAGLTKQQAQVQAANELARTPEGEAELTQAIEAAQEEYLAEQGPAPAPVIPELAENILKEIEVAGEIAKKAAIPKAAPGMPEAGLQPSMLEEVPAKEVRPVPTGKLVQSRLDDYLKLREYNAKAATDRISAIKKLLETPGRLAKGLGTRGNAALELARLEALQEVEAAGSVESLDYLMSQVGDELGLRSMPYQGYGGKAHIDLVRHPTTRLFKGYTSKQLEEMLGVYQQARQSLSPEVPATSIVKAEDIPVDIPALTSIALTATQVERTVELFKEAIAAPNTEMQRAAAIELRKHVLAQRATLAKDSAEAMIAEGMNPEEAIKVAEQQFMTGKLPDVGTDYFSDLTQEMRNVLFAKVYNYWKDKSWFELISTFEGLTNALAGKSIPRVKGVGTKYFPEGGSAWDRLARVFIGDMEVLEALDQGKSLTDIIEGVYLETGRGSVPLSQETINWLKGLATISQEDRILLEKPLGDITEAQVKRIAESWFYRRRTELQTLLKDGVITQVEYKLQLALAKDRVFPHKPITPAGPYPGVAFGKPRLGEVYSPIAALPEARTEEQIRLAMFELEKKYRDATTEPAAIPPTPDEWGIYNEAFKEVPLLTFKEKHTIVRTLKSLGMAAIDIGNLIRANKASFDFSFWRQAKALAAGHPVAFYRANIEAWKALWSQASAEANWQWITRDPDFELYEQIRQTTGADPLRILEAPKGTVQWRAAEEYGYLTGERAIPRFTAKIPWIKVSGRSFVVGTNTMSWLVWKKCLEATRARAMRIASGDIKLEEGEALSIYEEMVDYQKYIADAIQRASLGKAAPLAPALSAMFFAPRSKLARLLYPRHLISSNPRVRALAWKDFSLFIGTISSMVMLGYWLGLWDVERDPRNAEFMSIRIGNMRIDPWAGNRQYIVLYARLITGTGISSVTGQEYEVNPIAALTTFFRTSLSPLSSILLDFWTGKNFLGEEVDVANPKQWLDRILPFAIQDVLEAFQDDWQNGLISILPAIVGEGVQTYTGDWRENWLKLGLPKYPENTGYGIDEPVYDVADFWADTASALRGVDPATLTESKGYPEYVRSIAQALQIIEEIGLLPNRRLASLNVDPEEGTTFKQYYQMWQERQRIVASGDEDKLKEFDADERTRNAYLGNMTQGQYALLMEYHSLPESEQADFLGNHPQLYSNPREDWLRSHPEENALLALWGKEKLYSLEALDTIDSLARSLGIPENAMIARDLDDVTKLKIKNVGLFDLLDIYGGLDDTVKDAEGLTARDRAIQDLYTDNPDFRDDMRRIDALGQGTGEYPTPDDIIEGWVDRGRIVDEFGANSAEAKLWLLDNKEVHQWALGNALLSDDGSDWNEPIFRLIVEYRDDFDSYDAFGDITSDRYISDDDQRAEARRRLLFDDQENMTSFGKAYYTRDASGQGYSESNWNAYIEYSELPLWGSWRERFLLGNADFYKEYTDPDIGNHPLVDKTKVRPVARDRFYQQFYDEFQSWDETSGMAPKAIENMRAELDAIERGGLTFKEARYSVQAYDNGFPEGLIDDYVGWYSIARKDYEDDWWLMEHRDFYNTMYELGIWKEPRDFSKVPTRDVWGLYQTYSGLPSGTPRLDFRARYPELDAWLVLKFGYKPVTDRGSAEAEPTPWEELQVAERFKEQFK